MTENIRAQFPTTKVIRLIEWRVANYAPVQIRRAVNLPFPANDKITSFCNDEMYLMSQKAFVKVASTARAAGRENKQPVQTLFETQGISLETNQKLARF